MVFYYIFDTDENIIQIHNNKNIKFFCNNLINIALKICRRINQFIKHYLIFKMAISDLESYFLLISFINSYPVIESSEIKLNNLPDLFLSI